MDFDVSKAGHVEIDQPPRGGSVPTAEFQI
jgi:hypothetical protein